MNKEKFEQKINKRYGVSTEELGNLSISKIKNLKNINKTIINENNRFKIVKSTLGTIIKGASLGMGIAGSINTIFPNIIPVIATYITTSSNISDKLKLTLLTGIASLPFDIASGHIILGIGAGIGSVLYSGYTLIKTATTNLKIIKDKRLCKKNISK